MFLRAQSCHYDDELPFGCRLPQSAESLPSVLFDVYIESAMTQSFEERGSMVAARIDEENPPHRLVPLLAEASCSNPAREERDFSIRFQVVDRILAVT